MRPPIPNRLCVVPPEIYDLLDDTLANEQGYDDAIQAKRLRKVASIAYSQGYMDGYRDGHTDAENGHDERFTVHLA